MYRLARTLFAALMLAVPFGCTLQEKLDSDIAKQTATWPSGDADAGRHAFLKYECNGCHVVQGVDLPRPDSEHISPIVLGYEHASTLSNELLATAIIDPNHSVAREAAVEVRGRSPMVDHSEEMTVRELVDIMAFLRSLTGGELVHIEEGD